MLQPPGCILAEKKAKIVKVKFCLKFFEAMNSVWLGVEPWMNRIGGYGI